MKTIIFFVGFLLTLNLFATNEMEGIFISKLESSQEIYELNLNITKNADGDNAYVFQLTKALDGGEKKIETSISGKFKMEKTKIILYGESIIDSKSGQTTEQESKYTGFPIRVHVRNQNNKIILVLSAFGKILKLEKQI